MVAARLGLAMLALVLARGAAAEPLQCPPALNVAESAAGAVPQGWTPSLVDHPHSLAGIAFFSGDPTQEASLVPDKESKVKGKDQAMWRFTPGQDEIWLGCRYSDTAIVLGRKLPAATKECTIVYGAGMMVESISCK